MPKQLRFITAASVLALAAPAAAQVVVTVDDDAGNDSAYVAGVGGNFTGADALQQAVSAVNGDATGGITSWEIEIVDTDGVGDTYLSDLSLNRENTTITQVPNGSGTDVGVTLESENIAAEQGGTIVFNNVGQVLEGLSTDKRITLVNNAADFPNWGTQSTPAAGFTVRNVLYTGGGAGRLAHNGNAPTQVWEGCQFFENNVDGVGPGPQIAGGVATFNNCTMLGNSHPFVLVGSTEAANFNDSEITMGVQMHLGVADCVTTFTNCQITRSSGSIVTTPQLGDGHDLTFDTCTFGPGSGVPFINGDTTVSFTFLNCDLRPLKDAGIVGRSRSGSITMVDTQMDRAWDCAGAAGANPTVTFDVTRCELEAPIGAVSAAGITRNITAVNTIFSNDGSAGNMAGLNLNPDGSGSFTHCTFFGSTINPFFVSGDPTTPITFDYCIFSPSDGSAAANQGSFSGTNNIFFGNNPLPGLVNSFQADPMLDATGRLQDGSAASERADGSTIMVDVDGESRPQPMATVPDIGADEAAFDQVTIPLFGWPIQAVRIPGGGTAPSVDGVVNPGVEYAPTGTPIPTIVALSTLENEDPYFPEYTHQGTQLSVSGDFVSDGDGRMDLYFVYDDTNFYFAAVIQDEALLPSANSSGMVANSSPGVNAGDAFQLCMDFDDNNVGDGQQDGTGVYIPSFAPVTNSNDVMWAQQFWPVSAPNPMTGMQWAVQTNPTGYTVEGCIPWSVINSGDGTYTPTNPFPPMDGQVGGVLPILDDHDGANPGEAIAFMYPSGNGGNIIVNASAYNDLRFVETPTLPSSVQEWSLY